MKRVAAGFVVLVLITAAIFFSVVPRLVDNRLNKTRARTFASQRARDLHRSLNVADLHADSLLWGRDLLARNSRGQVDIPRLIDGNVALQVFSMERLEVGRDRVIFHSASGPLTVKRSHAGYIMAQGKASVRLAFKDSSSNRPGSTVEIRRFHSLTPGRLPIWAKWQRHRFAPTRQDQTITNNFWPFAQRESSTRLHRPCMTPQARTSAPASPLR